MADSESVGDVGVVDVANGEFPAENSGVVAPLNQLVGDGSGSLADLLWTIHSTKSRPDLHKARLELAR